MSVKYLAGQSAAIDISRASRIRWGRLCIPRSVFERFSTAPLEYSWGFRVNDAVKSNPSIGSEILHLKELLCILDRYELSFLWTAVIAGSKPSFRTEFESSAAAVKRVPIFQTAQNLTCSIRNVKQGSRIIWTTNNTGKSRYTRGCRGESGWWQNPFAHERVATCAVCRIPSGVDVRAGSDVGTAWLVLSQYIRDRLIWDRSVNQWHF